MSQVLGHAVVGVGPIRAIVLNDWIGDTTTWDPVMHLLDRERLAWAMVDLRGYGRSRGIPGEHSLAEAVTDVMSTADSLDWDRFFVVAHSMSTLVALELGRIAAARVAGLVLVVPPPPYGLGVDEGTVDFLRSVALGDPETRRAALASMWGPRLSQRWLDHKLERWSASADPEAAADYVDMFARTGLPEAGGKVSVPVLAITGERDAEPMRCDAVSRSLCSLCDILDVEPIQDVAHYPMQEAPPLTYTLVEAFLTAERSPDLGAPGARGGG